MVTKYRVRDGRNVVLEKGFDTREAANAWIAANAHRGTAPVHAEDYEARGPRTAPVEDRTRVQLVQLDETDPAALYHRYPSQSAPQPAHVELDLETGALSADYTGEVGPPYSVPRSVYDDRTLRWGIPIYTAETANLLLTHLAPIAQRILNGATIVWNGSANVGRLDAPAAVAADEMAAAIEAWDDGVSDRVEPVDAADWFSGGNTADLIDQTKLAADSTAADLERMAEELRHEADASTPGGYVVIEGTVEYLEELREELRDAERDKLVDVAAQIDALTEQRDALVRRQLSWGDYQRNVADRAGVSHTTVQRIRDAATPKEGTAHA